MIAPMSNTALFDPAEAGRQISETYAQYVQADRAVAEHEAERATVKAALIEQLRDAHGRVADFKAFLKEHVKIPRSTAYKLLAIADGRGEEIRRQEREAKQRQRVHDNKVMDTKRQQRAAATPVEAALAAMPADAKLEVQEACGAPTGHTVTAGQLRNFMGIKELDIAKLPPSKLTPTTFMTWLKERREALASPYYERSGNYTHDKGDPLQRTVTKDQILALCDIIADLGGKEISNPKIYGKRTPVESIIPFIVVPDGDNLTTAALQIASGHLKGLIHTIRVQQIKTARTRKRKERKEAGREKIARDFHLANTVDFGRHKSGAYWWRNRDKPTEQHGPFATKAEAKQAAARDFQDGEEE